MNRARIVFLFYFLALVAIVAIVGWLAGSRIESPAEAAARTAPPTPSAILVPVEQRVLSSSIVTRGTARFGLPQIISIAPSALKGNLAEVVTTLPMRNTQLNEGDLMFTASGRPVFVLRGETPAYRDLVPGVSGNDVRQLEQALERLGFDPGPVDGTYDETTQSAVAKWYKSAGFEPFWPTAEQLANIRALELALGDAKRAKMAADNARDAAELAVQSAKSKAQHADKAAAADIQVGIAERALVVADPRQLATARSAADAKIEVARAALKAAQSEGELSYQSALDAQKIAEFDAELAAIRADRLATELETAKDKLGAQIPVDEIVFLPALPVRVHDVTASIGSPASGPLMSVTDNQITIDSSLTLEAAPLVRQGMEVAVDEPAMGIKTKGTVEMVDSTPGTHGVDGYHIYFAVRVDDVSSPLEGFSLRLTIPIRSTGKAVTAVPLSAVSLTPDGTSRVQVERDGVLDFVPVEPGLAAGGFVEVTSIDGTLEPGQLVVVGHETNEPIAK